MMQQLILGFEKQLIKAIEIGKNQDVNNSENEIKNIIIAGLGGSGIGANLVEQWLRKSLKVPFLITKTYDIPAFVDQHTLFIACSFSGNTEETLLAFESAQKTGAKLACITSGGKLLEIAKSTPFDHVQIPAEASCPRAFIGYSSVQLLYLMHSYGFIDNSFEQSLLDSIALLNKEQEAIQEEAQKIAKIYKGSLPIVYADNNFSAVIIRLQQQINENSKQLCHTNIFPEMNHNELVGWGLPKESYKGTVVTLIRSSLDHDRVRVRMDICEPIFASQADHVINIIPKGSSFIEQSFYLIHLFDWISYYLALENEVDPFPVDIIGHLKGKLSEVK